MSDEMWTPYTLDHFVRNNPNGGTFWSKSRRTVRDLYTLHLRSGGVVVAIMMEKARGAPMRVYLFVKNGGQMKVNRFSPPPEIGVLLDASALSILPSDVMEEVRKFISAETSRIC